MTEQGERMQQLFFVRSPIFDADLNVVACELHFSKNIDGSEPYQVSFEELTDSFENLTLQEIVGAEQAILKLPCDLNEVAPPLSKKQMLIGIDAVNPSSENQDMLTVVKRLSREGYASALNDFRFKDNWQTPAKLAEVIKLNVDTLKDSALQDRLNELKTMQAKLCIYGIEFYDDFVKAKEFGFDYFQGPFLSRPWRIDMDEIPTNSLAVLHLLCGLFSTDVTPDELVELISRDPRLAYKLLAIINSAAFQLTRTIESLFEAVVMLGLNRLRAWASLIALSSVDDKPHELMAVGMTRAKMCEFLAETLEEDNPDGFFTVGLFSILDGMLDKKLDDIIGILPLAEELKVALVKHEGKMGMILHNVLAYEGAEWNDIQLLSLEVEDYREAYLKSIVWAKEVMKTLYD